MKRYSGGKGGGKRRKHWRYEEIEKAGMREGGERKVEEEKRVRTRGRGPGSDRVMKPGRDK